MKQLWKFVAFAATLCVMCGMLPISSVSADTSGVDLSTESDSVKMLGRTTVSEKGIEPHSTGAGIAFYTECEGDITLTMTGTPTKFGSLYLAVFVDGELHRVEFKGAVNRTATKELVIASGLAKGKHKIEIVRETEENYGRYVWKSVSLDGNVMPVEQAPFMIEFVGDSITAGYASYPVTDETKGLSVEHPAYEAGVKSYAYLTAQALGADFQSVCASGYGVVNGWNSDGVTVPMMYEYAGYYHDDSDSGKWTFERPADVVVINLSSNDAMRGTTEEQMQTDAKAFMETVRAHNPEAAVVWMTGVSSAKFEPQLEAAVQELGGAEQGFYFVSLPEGTSGGAGHPNLEEHQETSEALVQFLKDHVLPVEKPPLFGISPTALTVLGVVVAAIVAAVLFVLFNKKNAAG